MEYSIGQAIITMGRDTEDVPVVGEVRSIVDWATGIKLAWYRIVEVIPPSVEGWIFMIHAQICEEPKQ